MTHIDRRGMRFVAIFRDRYTRGDPLKVYTGKPGEMQETEFQKRDGRISTALGEFPNPTSTHLSPREIEILFGGGVRLAGMQTDELERWLLVRLGLVSADKPPPSAQRLSLLAPE